jgi:hypothetical protein
MLLTLDVNSVRSAKGVDGTMPGVRNRGFYNGKMLMQG